METLTLHHPEHGDIDIPAGQARTFTVELGASEVIMYMRMTGQRRPVTVHNDGRERGMVEIHNDARRQPGPLVTVAEAGFYYR